MLFMSLLNSWNIKTAMYEICYSYICCPISTIYRPEKKDISKNCYGLTITFCTCTTAQPQIYILSISLGMSEIRCIIYRPDFCNLQTRRKKKKEANWCKLNNSKTSTLKGLKCKCCFNFLTCVTHVSQFKDSTKDSRSES